MAKKHTYIIFDGDNDKWAYARMKGWSALPNIDFEFDNAHDIGSMTSRATNETYVKSELKKRFAQTKQVVVIIGESTKNLYRYVRWEIDVAQELDLPIIAVYLNGSRLIDNSVCPPILRDANAVHIPYKLAIIKYALDNFPADYKKNSASWGNSNRLYTNSVYQELGLNNE
jgi:hypothetical protein